MRTCGPWKTGPSPPLCLHPFASPAAAGLEGRGGSGIWVSVAWGPAVWEVCAGSVDACASVLGLRTAAGAVHWRLLGLALSFCPRICARYLPCGVLLGSIAPCTWSKRMKATCATACATTSAIGRSRSRSGDGRAPLGGWAEPCTDSVLGRPAGCLRGGRALHPTGLLAEATWTAGRAAGHAILQSDMCPFCRGAPETELHILWDCLRWESARRTWMPWVLQEAKALPALALPAAWPVCLKATGLLRLALVGAGEDAQAGRRLYRLYGMYLAVLWACRAAEEEARLGGGVASTVFGLARGRGPVSRQGYGWEQLADGPLRPAPERDPLQLLQGPLAGWPWEHGFAEALVHWASALQWVLGPG